MQTYKKMKALGEYTHTHTHTHTQGNSRERKKTIKIEMCRDRIIYKTDSIFCCEYFRKLYG